MMDSKLEKLNRLKLLHQKREEARRQNYKEVIEEDRKNKLPANWENKKRKVEWEIEEEKNRKEAEEQGQDYDRLKALNMPAEVADHLDKKYKKKKNPDIGFSSYEDATVRKHEGLVRQFKSDPEHYQAMKEKLGKEFYPTASTLLTNVPPDSKESIERMAEDVKNQVSRRQRYSRRRTFDPDADIDYINDKNMRFNKKLDKFYGQYTEEIKQNLERGTAL